MTETQRTIALAITRNDAPMTALELFREIKTIDISTIRRNLKNGPFVVHSVENVPHGKAQRWQWIQNENRL